MSIIHALSTASTSAGIAVAIRVLCSAVSRMLHVKGAHGAMAQHFVLGSCCYYCLLARSDAFLYSTSLLLMLLAYVIASSHSSIMSCRPSCFANSINSARTAHMGRWRLR
jgi:hypothetical protein